MGFNKHKYKGYNLTTYKLKSTTVEVEDSGVSWGMIIPQQAEKGRPARKYFGWYVLFMKKWVSIRKYKRIVPVRQDMIIDFLFWRFSKPINNNVRQWKFR